MVHVFSFCALLREGDRERLGDLARPSRQHGSGYQPDEGKAGYVRMVGMPHVPETSARPADPAVTNDYDRFAEAYSA